MNSLNAKPIMSLDNSSNKNRRQTVFRYAFHRCNAVGYPALLIPLGRLFSWLMFKRTCKLLAAKCNGIRRAGKNHVAMFA
jgi:hypothetical protein